MRAEYTKIVRKERVGGRNNQDVCSNGPGVLVSSYRSRTGCSNTLILLRFLAPSPLGDSPKHQRGQELIYLKRMKKSVLVLSAGGPCGISCIKALRPIENLRIVAADKSEYAAGLQFADISMVIPAASEDAFQKAVTNIVDRYEIDVLMPSFESGMRKLSALMDRFGLDSRSALLCQDKFTFVNACNRTALPVPDTQILKNNFVPDFFPQYVKPRFGSSSINNFLVRSQRELNGVLSIIDLSQDYLIQDYIIGEHWNVDVLVDNGRFIVAVPRRDIFQNAGQCITVEVRNYQPLIEFSREVRSKLDISSPFNLEVFEVQSGKFIINEINVRFGGGVIFSVLAGVDMVSYFATKEKKYLSAIKNGIYTRFYEEVLISEDPVTR